MIPSGTLIGPPIQLIRGDAVTLPIQAYLRPTGSIKAKFAAGDTLSASVYRRGTAAPIFEPSVDWYTAPAFPDGAPTQTGYDQGQVQVTATTAQAAGLQPGVTYYLAVEWSPGSNPSQSQIIALIPLSIGSPY